MQNTAKHVFYIYNPLSFLHYFTNMVRATTTTVLTISVCPIKWVKWSRVDKLLNVIAIHVEANNCIDNSYLIFHTVF